MQWRCCWNYRRVMENNSWWQTLSHARVEEDFLRKINVIKFESQMIHDDEAYNKLVNISQIFSEGLWTYNINYLNLRSLAAKKYLIANNVSCIQIVCCLSSSHYRCMQMSSCGKRFANATMALIASNLSFRVLSTVTRSHLSLRNIRNVVHFHYCDVCKRYFLITQK